MNKHFLINLIVPFIPFLFFIMVLISVTYLHFNNYLPLVISKLMDVIDSSYLPVQGFPL